MALITLVDKILKAIDKGDYVLGIFLDLSKAFDTADHSIPFNKLYKYGIRATCLDWINSNSN